MSSQPIGHATDERLTLFGAQTPDEIQRRLDRTEAEHGAGAVLMMVRERDERGRTPIWYASSEAVMTKLLDAGATAEDGGEQLRQRRIRWASNRCNRAQLTAETARADAAEARLAAVEAHQAAKAADDQVRVTEALAAFCATQAERVAAHLRTLDVVEPTIDDDTWLDDDGIHAAA